MSFKTTVYLPDDLKAALEAESKRLGLSEAEVIRRAIASSIARPRPRPGLFNAKPFADHADDLLAGFGER